MRISIEDLESLLFHGHSTGEDSVIYIEFPAASSRIAAKGLVYYTPDETAITLDLDAEGKAIGIEIF